MRRQRDRQGCAWDVLTVSPAVSADCRQMSPVTELIGTWPRQPKTNRKPALTNWDLYFYAAWLIPLSYRGIYVSSRQRIVNVEIILYDPRTGVRTTQSTNVFLILRVILPRFQLLSHNKICCLQMLSFCTLWMNKRTMDKFKCKVV